MNTLLDTSSSSSSSSSSSDTSSDEEELTKYLEKATASTRKKKTFHKRINCMEKYEDGEFERRFRLPKYMVAELLDRIGFKLSYLDFKNNPVFARDQILIALRFYATGCFQLVTADLFGVSQSTVSRIVLRVSKAIAELAKQDIRFPSSEDELQQIKEGFYKMKDLV